MMLPVHKEDATMGFIIDEIPCYQKTNLYVILNVQME